MKKLSALALAAALGLTAMAPIASVEAATVKKPAVHHVAAKKKESDLVCHMVKEKDGKNHKLCHHVKAKSSKTMAKKTAKKPASKKK